MELQLDLSREYGVVLEGGGARGSYQIGAWKALREAGVKIKGIAGASVGALNGALMCMDDLERAEDIWENIRYSHVMDVDDSLMEKVKRRDLKNIDFQSLLADGRKLLKDGGFDVAPLRRLIQETVDEDRIRKSDRELFVSTISLTDFKPLVVNVKELPEEEISDMLLASAYFPAFKMERLGGKYYTDGGGANNVPVDVLADRGYRDIIIIRIYGLGLDTERFFTAPEEVHVYHIAPRQSLGGILEFDRKRARRNLMLGYLDGKRMLYGLSGKRYYLDAPGGEAYYLDKMLSEIHFLQELLKKGPLFWKEADESWDEEEGELIQESGPGWEAALFPELDVPEDCGYRFYTEQLFPSLAAQWKLREDWDYKELYLMFLEQMARRLRISRFQVYTVEELLLKIHQKARSLDSGFQI